MSDTLQLILRAVQEFDISVSRARELIEIDPEGKFNYDLLPYGAGTQAIFGFDEVPVQKYKELLAERDSLVRVLKIANKNLFDVQEAAKIITKQAIVAETERDALVAKLKDAEHDRDEFRRVMNGFAEKMAELERQEPVVKYSGKRLTPEGTKEMWGYLLSEVEPRENQELYAHPVPSEEGFVTITSTEDGRCVMVSRQDEDHRILKVLWEAKDTPTEPAPLTDEEIREELRVFGKGGLVLRIARIIEAAVIRKNGFTKQT